MQLLERHSSLAHLGDVVRRNWCKRLVGCPISTICSSSKAASQNLTALIYDAQWRIAARKETACRLPSGGQQLRQQVIEFAAFQRNRQAIIGKGTDFTSKAERFPVVPFPLEALEDGLGAIRS